MNPFCEKEIYSRNTWKTFPYHRLGSSVVRLSSDEEIKWSKHLPMERPRRGKHVRSRACRSVNTAYFWANGMKGRCGGCVVWEFYRSLLGCQYRVAWDIWKRRCHRITEKYQSIKTVYSGGFYPSLIMNTSFDTEDVREQEIEADWRTAVWSEVPKGTWKK